MELKNLYTVKKVIETGSYQGAAAALNYAQSTVTFQMKQLETELSVKFFEKKGSRMELTRIGQELVPIIDRILESAEELRSYSTRDTLCGTLTIASPESLLTYQLQPVLKAFKEKAPNVKLVLQVMNCYAIHREMMDGRLDLAVHYDVRRYPESFAVRKLRNFSLVLVASSQATAADCDFVTPHQQKKVCCLQNDLNAFSLKSFERYLQEKDIVLQPALEVWSIEAIKRSAKSNLGTAFLPHFAVAEELQQGVLQEIPIDLVQPEITAVCVYKKNRWKSPAMDLFLQLVTEMF